MRKSYLKWGLISGAILIFLNLIFYALSGFEMDMSSTGEVFGYSAMIISLLLIFAGIRNYRDKKQNGKISFGKGLALGTMISVVAAVIFGIYCYLIFAVLEPDFLENYLEQNIEQVKQSDTEPAQKEAQLQELRDMSDFWLNPFLQSIVMFMTVFVLGFIIAVISSFILRRSDLPQARPKAPDAGA